jgi:uncharacterized membrane protein YbhN (UPF0104 family)
MDVQSERAPRQKRSGLAAALISWGFSLALLIGLIVLVVTHFGDTQILSVIAQEKQPWWLAGGLVLQAGTYVCAGALWRQVIAANNRRVPLGSLAVLAVESLSVNQIVPLVGMGGNFVVIRAMKRLGLPYALAVEAVLVEILSQFIAFIVLTPPALLVLFLNHGATPVILWLTAAFAVMMAAVSSGLFWLLRHRRGKPPLWLSRFGFIRTILDIGSQVSSARVGSWKLLAKTGGLDVTIFLLDAATLWMMMQAIGMPVGYLTAFAALVIAMLTGTLSLLPGGLGGFEAACTVILTMLGTPVQAALIGTLLLRGLTLWLPLVPGLLLSQRELHWKEKTPQASENGAGR